MRLSEFPRPREDNGRGLHWSPSSRPPTESALDFWMDELHAMHIKWLKVIDDGAGSSLPLIRRLIAEDIMPIVRLQRQGPPPHRLTPREKETVRRLVDAGVRYIEVDSEPDLPSAWFGNMPPNAFDLIIDAFIDDADIILEAGALPGIPPIALTPAHNPIQAIVERHREDLFQRGTWWAIHAYTYNRPLNYPDDDINRTGRPVTPEEYEQHHPWGWNEPPEVINQWRAKGRQPDATLADDPHCFRAYELAGQMVQEVLGYPIPIIATEGGAITGLRDDRRYPRLDPWTAAEWTVQINEFLQREAPPWFFTLCHWLIADQRIDPTRPHVWEPHCWYTHWWDEEFGFNGVLPVVERVKAMPTLERASSLTVPETIPPTVSAPSEEETPMPPMPESATISGTVVRTDNTPVAHINVELLDKKGEAIHSVRSDEEGRFRIDNVRPGSYRIHVADRTDVMDIHVHAGDEIDLLFILSEPEEKKQTEEAPATTEPEDVPAADTRPEKGHDQAIATEPPELQPTPVTETEGTPTTEPTESVEPEETESERITETPPVPPVTGEESLSEAKIETPAEAEASVPISPDTANSRVLGHILGGRPGVELILKDETGHTWETTLDEHRQFAFTHLPAGTYTLELVGIGPIAKDIHLDGSNTVEVTFSLQGIVMGLVMGGTPEMLAELISDTYGWSRTIALSPQGQYRFVELPPGTYRVRVEGHELGPITLQENETITMPTLDLRPPHRATLQGKITDAQGQALPEIPVHLMRRGKLVAQTQTALNGTYIFQNMPADEYQVIVVGPPDVVRTVRLEQDKTVILDISLPAEEKVGDQAESTAEETLVKTVIEPTEESPPEPVEPEEAAPETKTELTKETPPASTILSGEETIAEEENIPAVEPEAPAGTPTPEIVEVPETPSEEAEVAPEAQKIETPDIPTTVTEAVQAVEIPKSEEPTPAPTPGEEERKREMDIYILLPADGPRTRAILLAALPFLTAARATVGYNPEEARRARRVLIVGGTEAYGPEVEEMLRSAGCDVDRVTGTLAELVEQFEAAAHAISVEKEGPHEPVG